jgi:hypothetical protein
VEEIKCMRKNMELLELMYILSEIRQVFSEIITRFDKCDKINKELQDNRNCPN